MVEVLLPNEYPCGCGEGMDALSGNGNSVFCRPNGWKIRSSNASDAVMPVSCSITMPSRMMLVLLYSYCAPGAKFTECLNAMSISSCGVQAFCGCSSRVWLKPGSNE